MEKKNLQNEPLIYQDVSFSFNSLCPERTCYLSLDNANNDSTFVSLHAVIIVGDSILQITVLEHLRATRRDKLWDETLSHSPPTFATSKDHPISVSTFASTRWYTCIYSLLYMVRTVTCSRVSHQSRDDFSLAILIYRAGEGTAANFFRASMSPSLLFVARYLFDC